MKKYIYTNELGEEIKIVDWEEKNVIFLSKPNQPILTVKKHVMLIGDTPLVKDKSKNYLKQTRENIIKEGLKNGACKDV